LAFSTIGIWKGEGGNQYFPPPFDFYSPLLCINIFVDTLEVNLCQRKEGGFVRKESLASWSKLPKCLKPPLVDITVLQIILRINVWTCFICVFNPESVSKADWECEFWIWLLLLLFSFLRSRIDMTDIWADSNAIASEIMRNVSFCCFRETNITNLDEMPTLCRT
jgi:hypothetical protein